MFYILALDLEPTGLNPRYHEITQIGAILLDNDLEEQGRFETLVRPDWPERGLEDGKNVYEYTNISLEDLDKAPASGTALHELEKFVLSHTTRSNRDRPLLKNIILFGQNVQFDYNFLVSEYDRLGRVMPYDYHILSLESMYFAYRAFMSEPVKSLREVSLASICKDLGVTNKQEHNAMCDIDTTVKCAKFIQRNLKNR